MRIVDGTDGLMFADSNGEVSPLSASFLYATGAGRWEQLLDQLQAEGVEAARFFASGLSPSSSRRGCTVDEAQKFSPVLASALLDRQMMGDFVSLCDTGDKNLWPGRADQWKEHVGMAGDLARTFKNIANTTLVNELDHPSQHMFTTSELNELVSHFGAVPCSLSPGCTITGDELDAAGAYWPCEVKGCISIDTHFARGPEPAWDNANHGHSELRNIASKYKRARRSAEPQRCDDGVLPVGVFPTLLGCLGQGFNTWSTLHSSALRDCHGPLAGQDLEDLRLYIRAGRAMPRGRYHYENANNTGAWPNSPVKSAAFVEGPATTNDKTVWRVQSFLHLGTGQWYLIVYGPDANNPHLEMQNGFAPPSESDLVYRYSQHVKIYRIFQR